MLRFKAFLRQFFKRKSLKRYAIGRLSRFLQIKTPACKLRRVSLAENLHFDKRQASHLSGQMQKG